MVHDAQLAPALAEQRSDQWWPCSACASCDNVSATKSVYMKGKARLANELTACSALAVQRIGGSRLQHNRATASFCVPCRCLILGRALRGDKPAHKAFLLAPAQPGPRRAPQPRAPWLGPPSHPYPEMVWLHTLIWHS